MSTLWEGRIKAEPEKDMLAFTASISFDKELAVADIVGSKAHVDGLKKSGLITKGEQKELQDALDQIRVEIEEGTFRFQPKDEDIHTAIERRVTEMAGSVGAKLHTGRSRNDQVATAFRLWIKSELLAVGKLIVKLQGVLLERAKEAGDSAIPGYTHLQRAQPVYFSDHLLAHGWALSRDITRTKDAIARMNVSPLGAGALGGSSLGLNPVFTAKQMGFSSSFENSLDAVSDRDFAAETLFVLSMLGIHLSRMGEEIIFWSSDEVGFMELPEGWATGSSMLPQKKNPDIAELIRGKAGRLVGNLTGFLATLKGLPLAYNRDLQEDKEPVFDSVKSIRLGLAALIGLLENCTFKFDAMAEASNAPELAAISLAEFLVSGGTPFRKAHSQVGELVRHWQMNGKNPKEVVTEQLGAEAAKLIPAKPVGDHKEGLLKFEAYLAKDPFSVQPKSRQRAKAQ